jgi:hypothetical protein
MVVIVDPHIKRTIDYPVYKEGQELDLFAKNKHGAEFEGWCWSGSSAWIDFFNPNSWEWYKKLYKFNGREDDKWSWTESTSSVHIWNDMNEVLYHPSLRSVQLRADHVSLLLNSQLSSMGRKSRWRRILSITVVGNTGMFTTSMACSLRKPHLKPLKRGQRPITDPLCSPGHSIPVPRGLRPCGRVITWGHGSIWQWVSRWFSPTTSPG